MGTDPAPRSLLRQLPLPAKLVVTAFLIAVGLGYFSALVQLHMKHSNKDGEALPTLADVVERFSGVKKPDPDAPPPKSKIHELVSGNRDDADVGKTNMAPAFFAKSKGYAKACADRGKVTVDFEREGELLALILWTKSDPAAKKEAYEADRFTLPEEKRGKPLTKEFVADGDPTAVKIKTLIAERCQNCHKDQAPSLGTFAEIEPHATAPSTEILPGGWVRSNKQISTEALTQSTHAHLLSFAVLFSLTGFVFACSGYPLAVRCVVAPIVVIAQVADVSCWWLARVPGSAGPMFAQTIVATGGIVGSGLAIHIVFGILDLYDWKGKLAVVLLFLAGGGGIGYVGLKVIEPALKEERLAAEAAKQPKPIEKKPDTTPPEVKVSQLERLVMGPRDGAKWNGSADGSMARAFFDKDGGEFAKDVKTRGKDVVEAERNGERLAVQAWIRADPAAREQAFRDPDAVFPLPPALVGKPVTADYLSDDKKGVKVRAILTDRCARCHAEGTGDKAEDYPLEKYEQLLKYIGK